MREPHYLIICISLIYVDLCAVRSFDVFYIEFLIMCCWKSSACKFVINTVLKGLPFFYEYK